VPPPIAKLVVTLPIGLIATSASLRAMRAYGSISLAPMD
jgi:hypothetical protein